MNSATAKLEWTIITVVNVILNKLKKTTTGIAKRKPVILFFISIPLDANIALANRQNSTIPEHKKLIIIGSDNFGITNSEKLLIESKINLLGILKISSKIALEKKP